MIMDLVLQLDLQVSISPEILQTLYVDLLNVTYSTTSFVIQLHFFSKKSLIGTRSPISQSTNPRMKVIILPPVYPIYTLYPMRVHHRRLPVINRAYQAHFSPLEQPTWEMNIAGMDTVTIMNPMSFFVIMQKVAYVGSDTR